MTEIEITLDALTEENIPVLAQVGLGQKMLDVLDNEIASLQEKRALITGAGVKKSRVASEDGLTHGQAVVNVLEQFGKEGATSKEIRAALEEAGHPLEPAILHSTMSPLMKEEIVRKQGKRGSSVYKLKANGRKLLEERTARRGRQAAE